MTDAEQARYFAAVLADFVEDENAYDDDEWDRKPSFNRLNEAAKKARDYLRVSQNKKGGVYRELGRTVAACDFSEGEHFFNRKNGRPFRVTDSFSQGEVVVLYANRINETLRFARPARLFDDGRFERIEADDAD